MKLAEREFENTFHFNKTRYKEKSLKTEPANKIKEPVRKLPARTNNRNRKEKYMPETPEKQPESQESEA